MGSAGIEEPERRVEGLTVYEFHGSSPPRGEPHDGAFRGIWPEPPFYYLFFAGEPGEGLSHWLGKQRGWVMRDIYRLAYEEWQQVVAERVQVGPFFIESMVSLASSPPTEEAPGIALRIDPGLVFGSGLHGSTSGCLLALADLYTQAAATTVVDMGTGTGILAIACGALGATRVIGIDKNPLAVQVASRNIRSNSLQNRVALLVADHLDVLRVSSELLIMNLEPLILKRLLAEDAWLDYPRVIMSGFLESEWGKVKEFLPPAYRLGSRRTVNDWLTVTIARQDRE